MINSYIKTFLLVILLICNSNTLADEDIDANSLINIVKNTYTDLDSYQDKGVIEEYKISIKSDNPIFRKIFSTHYKSNGKFKLDWQGTLKWNRPNRSVIWGSVDSSNIYIEKIKDKRNTPLRNIIPIGYVRALQFNVPGLLMDEINNPLEEKGSEYLLEKKYSSKILSSYLLTKKHLKKRDGVTKYWINPDTFMIYKYENISTFSKTIINYNEIKVNEALSDLTFNFKPPLDVTKEIVKILYRQFPNISEIERLKSLKMACDKSIPDYSDDTIDGYKAWITSHTGKGKNPDTKIIQTIADEIIAIKTSSLAEELEPFCDRARMTFDRYSSQNRQHFTSPENTWNYYINSLKHADRRGAISCLASTARDKYRKILNEMPESLLKLMGESIKEFKISMKISDSLVEGVAIKEKNMAGFIYFQKINGDWKITEM